MFGIYARDPIGFAEREMRVPLDRAAKCLLRSLLLTHRMGVSG